jgi:hypothetical protein
MAKTIKKPANADHVVLRLKVKGPGIKRGRIPVPELIEICKHAQEAVNRQAEALEGRSSTLHPGPKPEKVRLECTLDLVELGVGSAVLGFDQAKPQPNLPAPGQILNLGQEAIREVGEGLRALTAGRHAKLDQGVLQSLDAFAEVIDARIVTSIDWIVPKRPGVKGVRATVNRAMKARVERQLKTPTTQKTEIDGILEMADFKPDDFRCRIHPAVGAAVTCVFDEELADEVYENIRRPVHLTGVATFNPHNNRIEEIRIASLTPVDPLKMNASAFFSGTSIEELAAAQSIDPIRNPNVLIGGWPDDDDVDEAVADINRHRH